MRRSPLLDVWSGSWAVCSRQTVDHRHRWFPPRGVMVKGPTWALKEGWYVSADTKRSSPCRTIRNNGAWFTLVSTELRIARTGAETSRILTMLMWYRYPPYCMIDCLLFIIYSSYFSLFWYISYRSTVVYLNLHFQLFRMIYRHAWLDNILVMWVTTEQVDMLTPIINPFSDKQSFEDILF